MFQRLAARAVQGAGDSADDRRPCQQGLWGGEERSVREEANPPERQQERVEKARKKISSGLRFMITEVTPSI